MKTFILSLLALLLPLSLHSQPSPRPWHNYFSRLTDYDDIEASNLEDLYEHLCELESSPIDLNSATDDDLRQLSFLSASQLEELTEYLDRYRPLRSLGELAMIQSLDPLRLQLLRCFVYISDADANKHFPDVKSIMKYGKHELVATASIPFYNRKGDHNGYLGYKYKHWLRYTFKYGKHVQIGLTGTQDAGEPFFSAGNSMGYDHYAYYAVIRQMGCLKTLALGQYKIRMGLGLMMNTGFTLGKTTSLLFATPSNSISPNSSRSDAYYLQGSAATFALGKHIDLTTFLSYRKVDATLNDDGTIRTLLKTGYHRTLSEMQRKHNASQFTTGASLRWRQWGIHLGANALYSTYNRDLSPNTSQLFRRYYPSGNNFYNASFDYGYANHRLSANGETAINNEGAIATLNTLSLKTSSTLTLTAIQRYYSYRYYSLFASSFSDGGRVQNESGIYLGAAWSPLSGLSVLAYSDFAYFPWARYMVSTASHSWDNMLQTTYAFSSRLALTARYRLRLRQEDYSAPNASTSSLIDKTEHRMRLALAYSGLHWTAKTQLDGALTTFPAYAVGKENSKGGMVSQSVGYTGSRMSASASVGYFNTHDYNSRIYIYERGMLYSFSFPMFYGEGMRAALWMKGNITPNLVIIGKIGTTKYFDRDVISSSYQEIRGSWKTDGDVQVKWRF